MAKFITKTKIKEIFKEHKRADISPETEAWVEQVLTDLMLQIQEEQELREEKLATKDGPKTPNRENLMHGLRLFRSKWTQGLSPCKNK
ncbi:MAG: hypothetical protein KatS3mg035_1230 [Bacteroidia bacterium]|nr:MAG: hypothetical protein KatS3mg035_1230 [Bacteroidia bacterium]